MLSVVSMFQVCACTSAGCAYGTKCSSTKGRTDKKRKSANLFVQHPRDFTNCVSSVVHADNLGGEVKVDVNNITKTVSGRSNNTVDVQ